MSQQNEFVRLHGPIELATATATCWRCKKETPVHALVAADVEEFVEGEEPERLEEPAFIYDLDPDDLQGAVLAAVTSKALNYKPTYSRTMGESSWANVCVHCDSLQGAFFMHSEPDSPFFGGPEEYKGLRVLISEVGFDVAGVSYSR